jgi:MurNAc alpha-1-phosphate uridylyltransferase
MKATEARLAHPRTAMVLAAGLGMRMRPLTDKVERAVVNVHRLADAIERHVAARQRPHIVISDERPLLMGTGGAVVKALPLLGDTPFFHVNSDTIWIDGVTPNLKRLAAAFDAERMDALLLLAPTTTSIGYAGRGDFSMAPDGALRRRPEREVVPFVYAGAAVLSPALFAAAPAGPFSLTLLFDRSAEAGRLHGLRLEGVWMHVGSPDAIAAAERAIVASAA